MAATQENHDAMPECYGCGKRYRREGGLKTHMRDCRVVMAIADQAFRAELRMHQEIPDAQEPASSSVHGRLEHDEREPGDLDYAGKVR